MQLDQFEGADFKYDNSFFKILAQKYPNKTFLVPNLAIFVISRNFASRSIRGCWFQMWQYCFQTPVQKIPKSGIFGPKFKDF